jgi:hypothetical protein
MTHRNRGGRVVLAALGLALALVLPTTASAAVVAQPSQPAACAAIIAIQGLVDARLAALEARLATLSGQAKISASRRAMTRMEALLDLVGVPAVGATPSSLQSSVDAFFAALLQELGCTG